jgi:hypothetical protein
MTRTRVGSRGSFSGQVIEKISAAETISNGDSGKVFLLEALSAGGAYSITMPTTLKAGVNYKFIVQENTPGAAITLAFGSAIVYGNLEQQSDTNEDNRVACAGVSNVIIGTSALKGDYLEFENDGTSWYVSGMSSIQTAISTS